MAARLLLVCVAFTVGLIAGKPIDFSLGIIEGGGDVVGVRSHLLSLPCTPTHRPSRIEWTHNDVIINGDPRRYVDDNGSLIISKVINNKKKGESDAGVYQCKVSNSEGVVISIPFKVTVAGMSHEFHRSPSNVSVAEGNIVRHSCSIESVPKANITWWKDGQPLPNNKRYNVTESELIIVNVKPEDGGSYRCAATNALINKKRTSNPGEVTVVRQTTQKVQFLLPESSTEPKPQIFRLGEKRVLICAASGIPRPNLKWIHSRPDGANFTSHTTFNGLNIFTIEPVTEDDAGVHTCIATQTINGIASAVSKVVNVEVEVPPKIIVKPKSQEFPAAKTVRIECEARGTPTPQIIWYKNGVKLHINGRIKQRARELMLGTVVTQDTGVYQCFAISSAGTATAAGRLVVNSPIDQPAPPTGLKCRTLSATQVSLSWNQLVKPDFKAFSVHYFPTEGGDEGKDVALNDSFIVDKLQPHTNYTFYVRSYSGKSASEQSKRVVCKTEEAVPTGAPLVTIAASSSHCVTIEWGQPPLLLARGTIISYEIQWKKSSQSSAYFDEVSGNTFTYAIPDLQGGTEYLVRVIGATSLGWPELTDNQAPWLKISTPKEKTAALPPLSSVQLYSVNSSSIEVMWEYRIDSKIDSFKLVYRNDVDIDNREISIPSTQRSYVIPISAPSSWFDVSVMPVHESIDSEICLVRYKMENLLSTRPTLPTPADLDASANSQNSINVTWTMADSIDDSIRFVVSYSLTHMLNELQSVRTIETSKPFAVINDLKPQTLYKITVQAQSDKGMSSVSKAIGCRTLPEVLGLIDNISYKVLSNTSIELTWDPLQTPVTGYTVFYNIRLGSDSVDQWHQILVQQNKTSVKLMDLRSDVDYVVKIRGESGASHGPLSAESYVTLPPANTFSNGQIHLNANGPSDQFLGILVGVSISICCIALCTGSLLYRKKCAKPEAQVPSSLSENGQCSTQCRRASSGSMEMKDILPTSPVNGMKFPLISNGLPYGTNRDKVVRITDNPQGRRGERSSSHSTDEGDSLLSGPELEMDPEETTQITLLVDSSLVVVAPIKETAPDDGFYETHVPAQPQW